MLGALALVYYAKFFRVAVEGMSLHKLDFAFPARTMDWIKLFIGDAGLYLLAALPVAVILGATGLFSSFEFPAPGQSTAALENSVFFIIVALSVLPFALIGPFIRYRHWKFFVDHMEAFGEINLDELTQSETVVAKHGEGLLDADSKNLQVEVAKIDMLNAVALPGGKVILFDGLVKQAKSADEVAGVLAHEIGHVRERHVMQSLLRQLGLSVVLGGLDGTGGSLLNGALSVTYTRGSEQEADRYSMKALSGASISPVATADFFDRLAKLSGEAEGDKRLTAMTGYMSSHPLSAERKKAFQNSIVKGKDYKPALTSAEWTELKTMCAQDRTAKEGFGLDF